MESCEPILSASVEVASTATVTSGLFIRGAERASVRALTVAALCLLIVFGFAFRAAHLGAEGLSEDELNKLTAVADYRAHGLTSANGEHPFLMKGLLTASIIAAERWNASALVASHTSLNISTEAALRLPAAIFGALISLLIYLLVAELFGTEAALIAAALWAFDPTGIGFNRIAKEDTFLLFFFLLANVFWVRGRRAAESGEGRPQKYYWATAAAFGAMMASKYMPHLIGISASYYHIFQGIERTRWRLGKRRWLIFFTVMGAVFLLCNPAILLPATWHEMKIFAGEHRITHDSYEFMGTLYHNQMTLWLKGVPWYFYFVFAGVKISIPILAAFFVGLPLLLRKRTGDGRYLILFWMLFWFLPFSVLGGKFTRYFTMALPVILITAALGVQFMSRLFADLCSQVFKREGARSLANAVFVALLIAFPALASAKVSPHYRLYTNSLGGGMDAAGSLFPHDEFYDAGVRDAVAAISARARVGARVASETPGLVKYYARLAGRDDLISISLSDREARSELRASDLVLVARGRRYFSNERLTAKLAETSSPLATIMTGDVASAQIFMLDEKTARFFQEPN